jgi:hypothetical protein
MDQLFQVTHPGRHPLWFAVYSRVHVPSLPSQGPAVVSLG